MALGAPASPNLFAPGVTDLLSQSGLSLRIRHLNYACLFSKDGVSFESESFGAWGFVTADDKRGCFWIRKATLEGRDSNRPDRAEAEAGSGAYAR